MKCILCEGNLSSEPIFSIKDRLKRDKRTFSVHECVECHSIIIDPIPTEKEIIDLYPLSNYTFRIDKSNNLKGLITMIEWELFFKRRYLRDHRIISNVLRKEQFSILDIGCGPGMRIRLFKDLGCYVEGLDISSDDIDYLKSNNINAHKGTVEDVGIVDRKYDIVSMFELIEHLPDPLKSILIIRDLLKDNALLVISVPILDSFHYRFLREDYIAVKEMPRHIFIPTMKGLHLMFKKAGFTLLSYSCESILQNAASFALSLFDRGRFASFSNELGFRSISNRVLLWLLAIFPGLLLSLYEHFSGISSEVVLFLRKDDHSN